jgi:magnesium-transporting ATPase (P-type)
MATGSEEFFLGSLFLLCGACLLALLWVIDNTSLGKTMREAGREVERVLGLNCLEMMRWLSFVCLFLGVILTIVAFIAYGGS